MMSFDIDPVRVLKILMCMNEIKAIKNLGEARPLTDEEVRECNRTAAESVKDRFEKTQVCWQRRIVF
jgi:hypothetical protein